MSATAPTRPATGARRPQTGPPLLAPAIATVALTVAYTVVNRATPHPDATGAEVVRYAQEHGGEARLGALLLLAAAVPLALCAAVFYRRLRALGITAPGSAIALVGGVLAAVALVLSAAAGWAGGRLPADAPPALGRALADVSFLAGGPAYAAGFALLVAGVSVSALLAGLLPRGVTWSGLVVAAAGMLALLALVVDGFLYLLPVVRFGGALWLLCAAALLPISRRRAQDA
ncbi:DUF4386 domain-containing protein [Kitasatospora sp. NPDC088134]|uniref:DUF4386 domain-containing protein n=1 Tax=Kitasatospora sp. NPDC088134 TaxID=3364071 RepID=UPI003818B731